MVNACGTVLYAANAILKWMQPARKQYCFYVLQLLALSHVANHVPTLVRFANMGQSTGAKSHCFFTKQ